MSLYNIVQLFYMDVVALTLMTVVGCLGMVTFFFSSRYLYGDSQYTRFFLHLSVLIMAVWLMVAADNLWLLLFAWFASNGVLILLMIHKWQWRAALNSGVLTAKILGGAFCCLAFAFALLYLKTGSSSIRVILSRFQANDPGCEMAAFFILVAAMAQSAIWPFHRWLLSSLNSPTPVSAMMHAGLVNGGGFLLMRFAGMYVAMPTMLNCMLVMGLFSACLGSLWKLIQHDVKRMLACSTMAQMGFMMAECGLGLFSIALAHLCWHSFFKAYLFLSSNNAAHEKRFKYDQCLSFGILAAAVSIGLCSGFVFSMAVHAHQYAHTTSIVLILFAFMMSTQLSIALLIRAGLNKAFPILFMTIVFAYLYGSSIHFIEWIFEFDRLSHPQPLNGIHLFCFSLLLVMWILMLFKNTLGTHLKISRIAAIGYIKLLTASQPHSSTITTHRNQYRYQ